MKVVNESSSCDAEFSFYDSAGNLAVPISTTYRIDCVTNGLPVLTSTAIPPASTLTIPIAPAQNAILDPANFREHRRVTVIASYGASDQLICEHDYMVENLRFAS